MEKIQTAKNGTVSLFRQAVVLKRDKICCFEITQRTRRQQDIFTLTDGFTKIVISFKQMLVTQVKLHLFIKGAKYK